jgi:hypothetical protein
MAALPQAIKDGNAAQFTVAYGKLTDACHQAANQAMIVIKVPESSSFPVRREYGRVRSTWSARLSRLAASESPMKAPEQGRLRRVCGCFWQLAR